MIFFAKIVYWLIHKSRIYSTWSKLYRLFYHRKYRKVKLGGPFEPDEILKKIKTLRWSSDTAKELWDAIGSPHWTQYCINMVAHGNPQPKGALDCDEFAIWCASVMSLSHRPKFLNVFWRGSNGLDGHNICLYSDMDGFYHIGNWGKSNKFFSVETLVKSIVRLAEEKAILIGFSIYTYDLKLKECHTNKV